ncbi:hypothetical protein D3C73_1432560 [compost metagenome]
MNKLNLTGYEGKAIVITGRANGGWIWSAKVEEVAGPLMSGIVGEMDSRVTDPEHVRV